MITYFLLKCHGHIRQIIIKLSKYVHDILLGLNNNKAI